MLDDNIKFIEKCSKYSFNTLFPKNVENKNPALGWENFSKLANLFPGPCFALGGLVQKDLKTARKNGAQGISGISGFFSPQNGTNQMR